MRAGDYKLARIAHGQRPDFAVVTFKFLNVLELQEVRKLTFPACMYIYLVAVPVLDHLIFAHCPEVMRRLGVKVPHVVILKGNLHHTSVMREDRAVAVAEVEAPYLYVLVRRAGHDELGVGRDVHREHRKLH